MQKRSDAICIGLLTLIGIWGIAGLWRVPGLPTSHDSIAHMARMFAYQEALSEGIFPVLWAKRMFWGIGSPVLMLNYQIPYYFAMIWHALGFSLGDSYKLVLAFSQVVSGLLMYRALRIKYNPLVSLAGAICYSVVPYRYLDIYVRGALGEIFSTMFPPLILIGMWRGSLPLQSIGWAGLFLSHPVGSALYSGVFLGYALVSNGWQAIATTLKRFFLPYGLALMIASFNILPTLALTSYTYYKPSNSDTLAQFPTLHQLVSSRWGYGHSTSDDQDTMSFQIGVVTWALVVLAVGTYLNAGLGETKRRILLYFVLVFVLSVLLMLKPTATPIYTHLGLGQIIDYPWRILMICSFVSAMMGVLLVHEIKNRRLQVTIVVMMVVISMYTNRNHIRVNAVWVWPSDSFQHGTGDAYGEYSAKYRSTREGSEFELPAELIAGEGRVTTTRDSANETRVRVDSSQPTILRARIMYFPGWVVKINGENIPIDTSQSERSPESKCFVTTRTSTHTDDSGLIACHLPPGSSQIQMRYQALPVQRLAYLLSLVGIVTLLWYMSRSSSPPTTKPKR